MEFSDSAMATAELLYFGDGDYGICSKFITDSLSSYSSSSPSCTTTINKRSKREISKECESSKGIHKKQKKEASASIGTIKVRKDKLGDRIATLQQLVSPFGKSDTASVLHEVLGYIHFLHDQVQVLISPYLLLPATTSSLQDGSWNKDQSKEGELRCQGLCLVQISSIEEVNDTNDAHLHFAAIESNLCSKKQI